MGSLVEHAQRELELLEENPQIAEAVLKVVSAFAEGGVLTADGTTQAMATSYVEHLLKRRPLSPLTSDPEEWAERSNASGFKIWQSLRNPEAFSEDGGKTYWLLSDPQPPIVDERTTYATAERNALYRPPNIAEATKMSEQGEDAG